MAADSRPVLQPLHPSILPRLDPEYVAFHNEHIQYLPPAQSLAWDPTSRITPGPMTNTSAQAVEVGNIRDIQLQHAELRVFRPSGTAPERGWPVLLWFHGGAYSTSAGDAFVGAGSVANN